MRRNDPRHGTTSGYINLKCRCDRCRRAFAEDPGTRRRNERYRRKIGMKSREEYLASIERAKHGTESKYAQGCRCDDCKRASADARRRRRQTPNPRKHNANAYNNGCRCAECRQAHADRAWLLRVPA